MDIYLYFLLYPESLVVSMLGASEFGAYLAAGTEKRAREQAVFFELDKNLQSDYFDLEAAKRQCVPHEDGRPKHSVYVATYRILEHIPLSAMRDLWLITKDGRGLKLASSQPPAENDGRFHLYQELCPVHPLIASRLNAGEFINFITDPDVTVSVPRICFAEMNLGGLAEDPAKGSAQNLPYKNIDHIRDCLVELDTRDKATKTVNRIQETHIPYRCIEGGFFVGDQTGMLYYPFPLMEEIEKEHHYWWRSAELA